MAAVELVEDPETKKPASKDVVSKIIKRYAMKEF